MANQHHATDPGKRPQDDVYENAPTCHLCQWTFILDARQFLLKFIHSGCKQIYLDREHRDLATGPATPPPDALAAWLGAA